MKGVFVWVLNRYRQLEEMGSHPAVPGGPEIAVDLTLVLVVWCLWLFTTRGVTAAIELAPLILVPLGAAVGFLVIDTATNYLS